MYNKYNGYMKLKGTVKKYSGRGRRLGFPTANMGVTSDVADGLYLGYTYLEEAKLPSLIYIGANALYGEKERRVESYILDFPDRDLYNKEIEVEILEKLRDTISFASEQALVAQMKKDKTVARHFFKLS